MNSKTRRMRYVTTPLALAGLLGVAVAAPGCGEDNPLCCTESDFQVGGTVSLEGSAGVTVQAVADISGIASAIVDDLTATCRTIAEELDVSAADRAAAEAIEDKRMKMDQYCTLAVDAITTFSAMASISITVVPPQCEASISAKADCQASCNVDAECDIKATPPTCEGGKLEISCMGSCTAEAGASVSCEGSCSGNCEGSCTAMGGVECMGKCDGTCMGNTMNGSANGTCEGTCMGTCEATAPSVQCSGTCEGSCDASCEASANASVKCDGSCEGEFEPLKCTGGELSGGCEVEAKCDASCDASVSAKAECRPPEIAIDISGSADLDVAGRLKLVLEANLGFILAVKGRLETMGSLVGVVAGNIDGDVVGSLKVACIPAVAAAIGNAVDDVTVSVAATVDIAGSVGM